MTARPLVSACIANRDYGRFLSDALDGLLGQTYDRVEIVVVDDGSVDDSAAVLERYRGRVKFELRPHEGQGAAVNRAFELSTGDIVLFHDSDDMLEPDAIVRIVAAFEDPEVSLVLGKLRDIDELGRPLPGMRPRKGCQLQAGDLRRLIAGHANFICPETTGQSYRRTALEGLIPIPPQLAPDLYLANLAALTGRVAVIDGPIGRYRVHGANKSTGPSRRGVDWLDLKLDERRLIDREVRAQAFRTNVIDVAPTDHDASAPLHDHIRAGLEVARRRVTGEPGAVRWAIEGIRSIATHTQFTLRSRVRHAAWFASAAIAPRPLACRLVLGRYPFVRDVQPESVPA